MRKWPTVKQVSRCMFGALLVLGLAVLGTRARLFAQGEADPPAASATTYTVQAGDMLRKLAERFEVTLWDLVDWNDIENPDLILVDQVLIVSDPSESASQSTSSPGAPLKFKWWVANWWADDPDYIAAYYVEVEGGQPPYTLYHDGMVQDGNFFEVRWRRCAYRPGSVGVKDATGTYVKDDYWLEAPYCPNGVEIIEPAQDQELTHMPRNFNVRWTHTVNRPPDAYYIQVQYQQGGVWRPHRRYLHRRGDSNLFFVPDPIPGDYKGRVRMWGVYDGHEAYSRSDWREFQFRSE